MPLRAMSPNLGGFAGIARLGTPVSAPRQPSAGHFGEGLAAHATRSFNRVTCSDPAPACAMGPWAGRLSGTVKWLWPNRRLSRRAGSALYVTNVQEASRELPAAHAFDREREDEMAVSR